MLESWWQCFLVQYRIWDRRKIIIHFPENRKLLYAFFSEKKYIFDNVSGGFTVNVKIISNIYNLQHSLLFCSSSARFSFHITTYYYKGAFQCFFIGSRKTYNKICWIFSPPFGRHFFTTIDVFEWFLYLFEAPQAKFLEFYI